MNVQNLRTLLGKTNNKLSIFTSLEILNQYNFNEQELFNLIREFLNDEEKVGLFSCPHFQGYESGIIGCISDENIKIKVLEIVLRKKCASKDDKIRMLKTLNTQTLVSFLKANKDSENNIQPYEIVSLLDSNKQIQFVSMLETMDLTLSETKEILVTLNDDVKQTIDSGDFSQEYKNTIRIPTKYRNNRKEVLLDPHIELEIYRGLDKLKNHIYAIM